MYAQEVLYEILGARGPGNLEENGVLKTFFPPSILGQEVMDRVFHAKRREVILELFRIVREQEHIPDAERPVDPSEWNNEIERMEEIKGEHFLFNVEISEKSVQEIRNQLQALMVIGERN